jgi:hypothetical protein
MQPLTLIRAIAPIVCSYVLQEFARLGEDLDYEKLKRDLEPALRLAVPCEFLDDEAIQFANWCIDTVELLFLEGKLGEILRALSAGNFEKAFHLLFRRFLSPDVLCRPFFGETSPRGQ